MSNLGSLVVSLEANIARFESDLGKAERVAKGAFDRISKAGDVAANAAKGVGLAMAGIAAGVGINTLVDKFEAVTKSLAGLKEMSERTGASVENLSGMSAIAKIGGRDLGEMEGAITKLNKALHSSDDESKGAAKALAAMGLDIVKLKQMDPAAAFMEIAKAQEGFADSGGKSAVMMDILGKKGAQQIPLMHDMAAAGDLVAKTTDAQAAAADAYEKDLRRLTMTKEALYKTIAQELIPVMDSFVKVLIQANNETDGVRKTAKDLAADGSIRSWAETAAIATAHVLDEFQLIKALAIEIATPIERVGRNIYTVGALASIAASGSLDEKRQAYAALKAENEKYFADLDSRLDKNRQPVTLFSDRVRDQLAADRSAPPGAKKDDSLRDYTSRGATTASVAAAKKTRDDPLGDWIKDYEARIKPAEAALASFAKMQRDAETSGAALTKAERAFHELISSPDWKTMDEPYKALVAAQFEAANAAEKAAKEQETLNALLNATPTAKLEEMRDKMLLLANAFETGRISEQQFIEASQSLTGNLLPVVKDAASSIDMVLSNSFDNMANSIADFVMGGKASFSDMINSMIRDLIKLQIQTTMTTVFKEAGGLSGIASAIGGLFSAGLGGDATAANGSSWLGDTSGFRLDGMRASGGPVAAGGTYLVGERGPELLTMGGSSGYVSPNAMAASPTINISVENHGAADGYQAVASAQQNGAGIDVKVLVARAITDDQRRNGPITQGFANIFGMSRSAA